MGAYILPSDWSWVFVWRGCALSQKPGSVDHTEYIVATLRPVKREGIVFFFHLPVRRQSRVCARGYDED